MEEIVEEKRQRQKNKSSYHPSGVYLTVFILKQGHLMMGRMGGNVCGVVKVLHQGMLRGHLSMC